MHFATILCSRLDSRLGNSRIPKYLQLVEAIEELVHDDVLRSGFQLPADSEIADNTRLSLGTVQRAMTILQSHGIVSREHGRGTFVKGIPSNLRDPWHFRFLADDGVSIRPVSLQIVSMEVAGNEGPWAAFLDGGSRYAKITRAIDVDGARTALSEFFVAFDRCKGLLEIPIKKLERSHLRDVLRERFGLVTARVVEEVGCRTFPAAVANMVGWKRRRSGLVCRIRAFDFRDRPVSYHVVYVTADAPFLEMRERKP